MASSRFKPLAAVLLALASAILVKAFFLDAAIVEGRSMLPSLQPGQIVLVLRCAYGLRAPWGGSYLLRWGEPKSGDIVAAINPRDGKDVVKRVSDSLPGSIYVLGDNPPESLDSREYGRLPVEDLVGKVLLFP